DKYQKEFCRMDYLLLYIFDMLVFFWINTGQHDL
ncbi:MAG: hypothetical protein ACI86M_002942, partial [Saprospiraceae bacterium]